MNKYITTAVALFCGISLAACNNGTNDDNTNLLLAAKCAGSSGSGDTTSYVETSHNHLTEQYTDIYELKQDTDFSTDIENIIEKICFTGDYTLDYDEVVYEDSNNTADYYKATYYLYNILSIGVTESNSCVIAKGVYIRDNTNKVKTLKEYTFDSPKTKAEADAYTGVATLAYYESFEDTELTQSTCRCIYMPSKNNEIDTLTTTDLYTPSGTGDLIVEVTNNYLPFNLKWDEDAKKGVAIDSSLLTSGQIVFKNYNGVDQTPVDFPVVQEKSVTYKKSSSGNPYDFEAVMTNSFQRIYSQNKDSIEGYNFDETNYYRYDFLWNPNVCTESYTEQICWELENADISVPIDIEDPTSFVTGDRSTTVIKDFKIYGGKHYVTRLTWLNSELKTNYYRVFEYEPVTNSDGSDSTTEYYEYLYMHVISDSTSDYPTHKAFVREGHQDYISGTDENDNPIVTNIYAVSGYSNEISYKDTYSTSGTSGNVANRSIEIEESRPSFANPLPVLKLGKAERF